MKKLLVVVDMQNDFIDGALGTKEAVSIVPAVLNKIKTYEKEGQTICFTKDTHFSNYSETQEGKKLPVVHCVKDSAGWEICDSLKDYAHTVFEKVTFGSSTLVDYLTKHSFDQIELVGLCTDICVISNALLAKAFNPEVPILVDANCCAGVTPESHNNALEAMRMCQIQILS